jgi:hypothetical protein
MAVADCPYCETTLSVVSDQGGGKSVQLDGSSYKMKPFTVSREEFKQALLEWLIAGDYTPDDLLERVMVQDHTGIYASFYLFGGFYTANWTAAAGFDRTESYVDTQRIFQDGKWVDQPVAKTRTVTDWRPVSGEVHGEFSMFCSASKHIPEGLLAFCEASNRSGFGTTAAPIELSDLDGFLVEATEIDSKECFDARGRKQLDKLIEKEVRGRIPGDRSRDERWDSTVRELKATSVYLPFWLVAYNYGDRRFHFILDGQDSTRHEGERPVDEERKQTIERLFKPAKIWGIVWLIIGIVGIFLVGIPTLLALLIGLPVYLYMNHKAKKQKDEILERSREIRRQALEAIRSRGGLNLDDDPGDFST